MGRVLTTIDGEPRLVTSEQMDAILGKCIDCGHIFQVGEMKYSKLVGTALRFTCETCHTGSIK